MLGGSMYLKYLLPWTSVRLMLALTAFRTQELYHLISSTFGRYLLYEIVKRPTRVLLIGCFKPPRLSRPCYLPPDYLVAYAYLVIFLHNRILDTRETMQ